MFKQVLMIGALVLASTEIYAQSVTIRGARLSGTGCNSSTANATTTDDGQFISILFDNFSAEMGVGSANPTMVAVKKACNISIDVDVPSNYQYALVSTDYRGFAALPASAYGYHRFSQIITGKVPPAMREHQFKGGEMGNYQETIGVKPGREVYSDCNKAQQTITILAELSLAYYPGRADHQMAQINLDSVDTGVQSRFKLMWRACK